MSDKLKPCPFCGSEEAKVNRALTFDHWSYFSEVCCPVCRMKGPVANRVESPAAAERIAIEKWNQRHEGGTR